MTDIERAKELAKLVMASLSDDFTYSIDTHDWVGVVICHEGMTSKIPLWLAANIARMAGFSNHACLAQG